MGKGLLGIALVLLVGSAAHLEAQDNRENDCTLFGDCKPSQAWDAPTFMSPGSHNDLGIYFIKPKDSDWGIAGTWRSGGALQLGVRGEYIQILSIGGVTDSRWGLGAEAKGGLGPVAPPLAMNWTAGIGALFGQGASFLTVPVGLSLGLHLASGGLVLTPYVHPRIALAYTSVQNGPSRTDALFNTDLGADLDLGSPLIVRIGGTLGDTPAIGAGLAIKLGRRY